MTNYPESAAVALDCLVVFALDACRIARGPFLVQHLDEFALCDYRCQCGIVAACSLYHFLGQLACPAIQSALGIKATALILYSANMLADLGMTQRQVLVSLVASSFLTQSAMMPYAESLHGAALHVPSHAKMHFFARRVATLLGPWFGVLIASDFKGCIWLSLTASSLLLPILFFQNSSKGSERVEKKLVPLDGEMRAVIFVLLWRFFLGFGFYTFNMLLAKSFSQPWLLALMGSLCAVGEVVAVKVSSFLGMRQVNPIKFHWQDASSVASFALKVVALSRLSALLISSKGVGLGARANLVEAADFVILLFSLVVSIIAATLLSDLQAQASRIVRDGRSDILHLERAADALAGVAGPLYVRSIVTHHGSGVAMVGLISLYIMMHLYIHLGLRSVVAPFADGVHTNGEKASHSVYAAEFLPFLHLWEDFRVQFLWLKL